MSIVDDKVGICCEATQQDIAARKKAAATARILRRRLAPNLGGLRGLRDRAILLVGFAGAVRSSELAAIRFVHLETTGRGIRLTLPQTKGEQTDVATIPSPYGDTELCPMHALELWQRAAEPPDGPVFRRVWPPPHPSRRRRARPLPYSGLRHRRSSHIPSPRSSRRAR